MDAALALHRLDQDRRRLVMDGRLHRRQIAEWQMRESLRQRAEAFFYLVLTRGGNARHRPSVERVVESNDLVPARGAAEFARQLDQPLIGLRSAIAEEHLARCDQLD